MKLFYSLAIGVGIVSICFGAVSTAKTSPKTQVRPKTTPAYKDVKKNHWAYSSVLNLKKRKIMAGRTEGRFEGDKPITRYEFAVALDRFIIQVENGLKKAGHELKETKVIEEPKLSVSKDHWAYSSMKRLAVYGYLPVSSKVFHGPGDTLNAKEIGQSLAQVVIRINDLTIKEPYERSQTTPDCSEGSLSKSE